MKLDDFPKFDESPKSSKSSKIKFQNPHKHEIEEIPDTHVKCKTQWPEGRKQFRKCILDFGVRSSREYDADEREKRINILVGLEAVCPELWFSFLALTFENT